MTPTLRPFTEADLPALVALHNRCRPDLPRTEASLRHLDAVYGGDLLVNLVATSANGSEGPLLGAVRALRAAPGSRKMRLTLLVPMVETEGAEGSFGLARTLYEAALGALASHQPTALETYVREGEAWLGFFEGLGFGELERMWESHLDVQRFDPAMWEGALVRAAEAGLSLRPLADLPATEATQRLLYDLTTRLLLDVPFSEPPTLWPLEVWRERVWGSPYFLPEGFFLAFDRSDPGRPVGLSELYRTERPGWLSTGLTGVGRAYRRQGVALALKVRAASYAKAQGMLVITTRNHTTNGAMLGINERLGFARQPAWITLKKTL